MPNQNTALRNRKAESVRTAFAGGKCHVRSGSRPADPNTAAPGTLLANITPLPSPAFNAASNGSITKAGTWEVAAAASGTAGWLRIFNAAETEWMDFQIGVDATMADTAVTQGVPVRVDSVTLTENV